eukprot:scaffold68797_cov23-Tisochrysis_lutea.AAC.4
MQNKQLSAKPLHQPGVAVSANMSYVVSHPPQARVCVCVCVGAHVVVSGKVAPSKRARSQACVCVYVLQGPDAQGPAVYQPLCCSKPSGPALHVPSMLLNVSLFGATWAAGHVQLAGHHTP